MEWHPAACIFPMLDDEELQELADDIKRNGQRVPIIVDKQNRIIDGRNRNAACRLAGVEPRFETYEGDDVVQYVLSLNLQRRQLTSSQRAIACAKAEDVLAELAKEARESHKRNSGRPCKDKPPEIVPEVSKTRRETSSKAAALFGTNDKYVKDAKKLVKEAPEVATKVERGEMTISQAKRVVANEQKRTELDKKAEEAKAEAFKAEQPPWTLIQSETIDGLETVVDHHDEVDLIFADPPYNIGIDYGYGADDDLRSDDDYMHWVYQWIEVCWNALRDTGTLWVMINDEYAAEYRLALKEIGFYVRNWVKWYETFGVNCSKGFNRTSRHLFYCVKNKKDFTFNSDAVSRPSDRQAKYGDKRANPTGKIWDDVWTIPRLTGTCAERIPDFPTQLPLALVQPIVECCSDPGDLVVDPFNGSGTTGVAAIQTHRKYIGIDQSEAFIDASEKRLMGAWHDIRGT